MSEPPDPPIIVTGGDSLASQPPDPPIIVTGGSVTIEFDPSILKPNGKTKFTNANKRITRVEVTGEGIDFGEDTADGQVTIKIYFGGS
ncbi:MAG: hypothetical protein ABW208_08165 [Pyrinomonadaceae bacterium]